MKKVCIIGAGPAGLMLALLLCKRGGFDVVVVEKGPDHNVFKTHDPSRSYTIDVTGKGLIALHAADVMGEMKNELIAFRGIRILFKKDELFSDELGSGVTGSRGEICRVLLRCLRERFPECEVVFETAAELVDGSTQVRIGASLRHFDLVCGADGAGSRTREELGIRFESGQFSNCSTMIRMDQNLDELDPTFLHFFSFPPVMLVAGAVNGPQNPLWFCQIGTDGPIPEMSSEWLRCNCPALLKWVSEKEMTAWSKYASSVPSGRWKILDSFVKGNVALIGDAACPFIPVGQGLNAGLLSAVFLDKSLGRCNNKIDDALLDYNRTWRPEALAASEISRSLDLGGKFWLFRSVRRLLLIIIGAAAVQNAKSSRISYQDALAMEKRADTMILVAVVVFGLALVWRISKGFH